MWTQIRNNTSLFIINWWLSHVLKRTLKDSLSKKTRFLNVIKFLYSLVHYTFRCQLAFFFSFTQLALYIVTFHRFLSAKPYCTNLTFLLILVVRSKLLSCIPLDHPVGRTGWSNQPGEYLDLLQQHLCTTEFLSQHCRTQKMFGFSWFVFACPVNIHHKEWVYLFSKCLQLEKNRILLQST